MNDKLVKVEAEPTAVEKRLVRTLLDRWDTDNGYPLDDLIADMRVVLAGTHQDASQVAPVEPTADVADIIAGSLQTSRSHAYELMRNAVIEQDEYFASSTTPQVEPTRAALEEFEEHLRNFATSDDKGIVEPKEPFSWETLARVAIDLARAALKNGESVPPLSGAALDAAVAKASRDSLVKLKDR